MVGVDSSEKARLKRIVWKRSSQFVIDHFSGISTSNVAIFDSINPHCDFDCLINQEKDIFIVNHTHIKTMKASLSNRTVCLFTWIAFVVAALMLPKDASAFVVVPLSFSAAANVHSHRPWTTTPLFATPVQVQEQDFWQRSADSNQVTERPEIVYILLYNPGTAEEGVHTTRFEEDNTEILWAFVELDDCMQFATLLKETEPPPEFNMALYPEPIPTPAPLSQMETASRDMGLLLRIVPAST